MNMTQRVGLAMAGLAFTLAAASPAGAQAVDEAGSIKIIYAGRQVILSLSDLSGLPRHDVRLADEANDKSSVSGVALWDVLQKAVLPPRNASGRHARWIRGLVLIELASVKP